MVEKLANLEYLRPLGALERYMITRSGLGIYNNVAVTAKYCYAHPINLRSTLFHVLEVLVQRSPSMSAVPIATRTAQPYFVRLPWIDLEQVVSFIPVAQHNVATLGEARDLDRFLEEQHNHRFEYTDPPSPFWKLFVFSDESNPSSFTLTLLFHHCIADTKSAVVLLEEIEEEMNGVEVSGAVSIIKSSSLPLPPPLDVFEQCDSTLNTLHDRMSAGLAWSGGRQFIPAVTRFSSYSLTAEKTSQLIGIAKPKLVSLTALLQSLLVAALFEVIPPQFDVITADCPVSLRPWLPHPIHEKSMGCLIDNFSTRYSRSPFQWSQVTQTQARIDHVVRQRCGEGMCEKLASLPDIQAWLQSEMGQVRSSAIELSNVGRVTYSARSRNVRLEGLLFSQSAGACSGAVKVSAVTGKDGRLSLGFSWQRGVVEDELVEHLVVVLKRNIDEVTASVDTH